LLLFLNGLRVELWEDLFLMFYRLLCRFNHTERSRSVKRFVVRTLFWQDSFTFFHLLSLRYT
jgi:hypothetical protein